MEKKIKREVNNNDMGRRFENTLWKEMCNRWWGFESYVGRHFTRQEGYCLFRPLYAGESLYDAPVWDRVLKDLDDWRVENESFRKST